MPKKINKRFYTSLKKRNSQTRTQSSTIWQFSRYRASVMKNNSQSGRNQDDRCRLITGTWILVEGLQRSIAIISLIAALGLTVLKLRPARCRFLAGSHETSRESPLWWTFVIELALLVALQGFKVHHKGSNVNGWPLTSTLPKELVPRSGMDGKQGSSAARAALPVDFLQGSNPTNWWRIIQSSSCMPCMLFLARDVEDSDKKIWHV